MSSNVRRTAFARVPRNPSAFAAYKAEKLLRVNKRFLDSLTSVQIEPEVSTILTKCEAELAIKMGANGKGTYSVSLKDGRTIGDSADVQKIQQLGSFINSERKNVLKSSVSAATQRTLAAIVEYSKIREDMKEIVTFPRNFVDALRALTAQMDTLADNVAMVQALDVTGEINIVVKNHIIENATKIRSIVGEYIMYRASLGSDDVPEKLNARLNAGGVMVWTYTRLTAQKLQLGGKDFELRKIYFPKDPTKGLQITFKEWNTPEVKEFQSGILKSCTYTCQLWTWENARAFLGAAETEPDFVEAHKSLANVPLLVVPPPGAMTAAEIVTALSKSGDKGLSWSVGTTTKPQDTLKFMGTVPKRIYLGLLARPALKTSLLKGIFPSFDPAAEGVGIYPKIAKQSRNAGFDLSWPDMVARGKVAGRLTLTKVSLDVFGVSEGALHDSIQKACQHPEQVVEREIEPVRDKWAEIMSGKAAMTDDRAQVLLANRADPSWFVRKKKVKEPDFRTARSLVTSSGQALIKELKTRRYKDLAIRIEAWLRTFLTADLQAAVAEVLLAKLDASLSQPVQYGKVDHLVVLQPIGNDSDDESEYEDEDADDDNPDDE